MENGFSKAFGDWDTYLKSANAFKSKAGKTDVTTFIKCFMDSLPP